LPDYVLLNGLEFESYMKRLFEIQGYVVFPTKSTGDQGADLILMKNHEKTAVQIKKYSGKVSNKAVQEVVASKKFYNCENALVVTNSEFTDSAIQLAKVNKVELWDSIKLKRVINKINEVYEQ
jgi:restriction system protein